MTTAAKTQSGGPNYYGGSTAQAGQCAGCREPYPAGAVRCYECGTYTEHGENDDALGMGPPFRAPGERPYDVEPMALAEIVGRARVALRNGEARDNSVNALASLVLLFAEQAEALEAAESRIRALESERGRR